MDDQEQFEEIRHDPIAEILRDPRGLLRRRWRTMALVAVLGVSVTAAVVALQETRYVAKATIMISSQKLSEEFVRPTIQEDTLERVNALLGEALSRENLTKILEQRDLYPKLQAEGRTNEALNALRMDIRVGMETGLMGQGSQDRARILAIECVALKPQAAADLANDVANLIVTGGVRLRSEQARLTTEFMRKELASAEEALREQNRKITDFKEKYRGELPDELEPNLRRLEMLQNQRQSLATQIAEGETRVAMIASGTSHDSGPAKKLAEARSQLAQELSTHTEAHPDVIALRKEIDELEAESKQSGGSDTAAPAALIAAAHGQVGQLRGELASTEAELRDLEARVARTPARQEEYAGLSDRAKVLEENYVEFSRKVKEAELAENLEHAQQGDRVAILDSALPPNRPDLRRWKLAAAGLFGTIVLSCLMGLALEWRDPILVSAGAVESLTGLSILGSVPHLE
jgi:uncharacterized protein involved in exopolysaccharide biosynthesis